MAEISGLSTENAPLNEPTEQLAMKLNEGLIEDRVSLGTHATSSEIWYWENKQFVKEKVFESTGENSNRPRVLIPLDTFESNVLAYQDALKSVEILQSQIKGLTSKLSRNRVQFYREIQYVRDQLRNKVVSQVTDAASASLVNARIDGFESYLKETEVSFYDIKDGLDEDLIQVIKHSVKDLNRRLLGENYLMLEKLQSLGVSLPGMTGQGGAVGEISRFLDLATQPFSFNKARKVQEMLLSSEGAKVSDVCSSLGWALQKYFQSSPAQAIREACDSLMTVLRTLGSQVNYVTAGEEEIRQWLEERNRLKSLLDTLREEMERKRQSQQELEESVIFLKEKAENREAVILDFQHQLELLINEKKQDSGLIEQQSGSAGGDLSGGFRSSLLSGAVFLVASVPPLPLQDSLQVRSSSSPPSLNLSRSIPTTQSSLVSAATPSHQTILNGSMSVPPFPNNFVEFSSVLASPPAPELNSLIAYSIVSLAKISQPPLPLSNETVLRSIPPVPSIPRFEINGVIPPLPLKHILEFRSSSTLRLDPLPKPTLSPLHSPKVSILPLKTQDEDERVTKVKRTNEAVNFCRWLATKFGSVKTGFSTLAENSKGKLNLRDFEKSLISLGFMSSISRIIFAAFCNEDSLTIQIEGGVLGGSENALEDWLRKIEKMDQAELEEKARELERRFFEEEKQDLEKQVEIEKSLRNQFKDEVVEMLMSSSNDSNNNHTGYLNSLSEKRTNSFKIVCLDKLTLPAAISSPEILRGSVDDLPRHHHEIESVKCEVPPLPVNSSFLELTSSIARPNSRPFNPLPTAIVVESISPVIAADVVSPSRESRPVSRPKLVSSPISAILNNSSSSSEEDEEGKHYQANHGNSSRLKKLSSSPPPSRGRSPTVVESSQFIALNAKCGDLEKNLFSTRKANALLSIEKSDLTVQLNGISKKFAQIQEQISLMKSERDQIGNKAVGFLCNLKVSRRENDKLLRDMRTKTDKILKLQRLLDKYKKARAADNLLGLSSTSSFFSVGGSSDPTTDERQLEDETNELLLSDDDPTQQQTGMIIEPEEISVLDNLGLDTSYTIRAQLADSKGLKRWQQLYSDGQLRQRRRRIFDDHFQSKLRLRQEKMSQSSSKFVDVSQFFSSTSSSFYNTSSSSNHSWKPVPLPHIRQTRATQVFYQSNSNRASNNVSDDQVRLEVSAPSPINSTWPARPILGNQFHNSTDKRKKQYREGKQRKSFEDVEEDDDDDDSFLPSQIQVLPPLVVRTASNNIQQERASRRLR